MCALRCNGRGTVGDCGYSSTFKGREDNELSRKDKEWWRNRRVEGGVVKLKRKSKERRKNYTPILVGTKVNNVDDKVTFTFSILAQLYSFQHLHA